MLALLLADAHGREVAIEVVEPQLPLPAERLQPVGRILDSGRDQPSGSPLRVAAAFDEARILQDLEVLRDGWLAEVEGCDELRHGGFAFREARQDRSPRWVRQG